MIKRMEQGVRRMGYCCPNAQDEYIDECTNIRSDLHTAELLQYCNHKSSITSKTSLQFSNLPSIINIKSKQIMSAKNLNKDDFKTGYGTLLTDFHHIDHR